MNKSQIEILDLYKYSRISASEACVDDTQINKTMIDPFSGGYFIRLWFLPYLANSGNLMDCFTIQNA